LAAIFLRRSCGAEPHHRVSPDPYAGNRRHRLHSFRGPSLVGPVAFLSVYFGPRMDCARGPPRAAKTNNAARRCFRVMIPYSPAGFETASRALHVGSSQAPTVRFTPSHRCERSWRKCRSTSACEKIVTGLRSPFEFMSRSTRAHRTEAREASHDNVWTAEGTDVLERSYSASRALSQKSAHVDRRGHARHCRRAPTQLELARGRRASRPLLIAIIPCAAMCALGMCMSSGQERRRPEAGFAERWIHSLPRSPKSCERIRGATQTKR